MSIPCAGRRARSSRSYTSPPTVESGRSVYTCGPPAVSRLTAGESRVARRTVGRERAARGSRLRRMRRHAHALARRALGPAYPRALRRWRRAQGAYRSWRVARVTRRFVDWHGLTVSGGPFAGPTYPARPPLPLAPKLLGIYERELHGAIEAAIRAAPETIVNVGSADGYYAVGL